MSLLSSNLIDTIEKQAGESMDYLRRIQATSRLAIWKFFLIVPLAAHGRAANAEHVALARIAATRLEDCGACLQMAVNDALKRGIDAAAVRAAANGEVDDLGELQALVYKFASAIQRVDPSAEQLRLELEQQLSPEAMTELALAIAMARVFPTIKRALGFATACSSFRLENSQSA